MHEHIVTAVVGLNEAEALCRVEPLNCSGSHFISPGCANARCARTTFARARSDFSDVLGSGAGSARSARQTIIRMAGVYAIVPEIASDNPIRATCPGT